VGALGGNWLGGEEHLLGRVQAQDVHEPQQTGGIVGDSQLRRCHGELSRRAADENVAGEGKVTGAAPDTAVNHGDDGHGHVLDRAQHPHQGILVAQGVPARGGQFLDVMSGGPDLGAGVGSQHDYAGFLLLHVLEGLDHLVDEGLAERVAVLGMVHRDGADVLLESGLDVGHFDSCSIGSFAF